MTIIYKLEADEDNGFAFIAFYAGMFLAFDAVERWLGGSDGYREIDSSSAVSLIRRFCTSKESA